MDTAEVEIGIHAKNQPKKKRKLTPEEKALREDSKYISQSVGWKTKHVVGRKMAHDEETTGAEAPSGFQIEDPAWSVCQDGSERLQLFRGNRLEALDNGEGTDVDHILQKWIDGTTGEFTFMLESLQSQGFRIIERGVDGLLVEREVTISEAYVERLEQSGRVGPAKFQDDFPETFARQELARRMEHENPTNSFRDQEGQRDRLDSPSMAPKDPEDVPWGDDPPGDVFGQGVQTVDSYTGKFITVDEVVRGEKTGFTKLVQEMKIDWYQEKPVFGCIKLKDGTYVEGKVGREQTARPFHDLIFPERFEVKRTFKDQDTGENVDVKVAGWDVLDSKRQVIEGLSVLQFEGVWEHLTEIKRRVDCLDKATIRGAGYLPWGEPCVKVLVEIPLELLAASHILMMVGTYSDAKYFAFSVTGPAVPALKDELEFQCRKARAPSMTVKRDLKRDQELVRLSKAAAKSLAATTVATGTITYGFGPAIEITGSCEVCGRPIGAKRLQALQVLMDQMDDVGAVCTVEKSMRRCLRTKIVRDGDRKYKQSSYCDGSDVVAFGVKAVSR